MTVNDHIRIIRNDHKYFIVQHNAQSNMRLSDITIKKVCCIYVYSQKTLPAFDPVYVNKTKIYPHVNPYSKTNNAAIIRGANFTLGFPKKGQDINIQMNAIGKVIIFERGE